MERRDDDLRPLAPLSNQGDLKLNSFNAWSEKLVLTIFSIIFNAIFGWLFYVFTTNPFKYGEECRFLQTLGFYFACYCFICLALTIIINPFILWYNSDKMNKTFDVMYIVEGFIRLMFFIAFCLGFIIGAQCGSLRWLTAGYILLNVVIFFMSSCIVEMEKVKDE